MTMRAIVLIVAIAALQACSESTPHRSFATPQDAAQALVIAAKADDTRALLEVLGSAAAPVIDSSDPVRDRRAREQFAQAYETAHTFVDAADDTKTLQVGADQWPFPFPLRRHGDSWRFDSSAGAEEIINRRVGENELHAIQACLAFVDAEREYYSRNPQNTPLLQYARILQSSQGQKDGLYWPTTRGEELSPLGEEFARARSEGYFEEGASRNQPYRGYVYRLLTMQGPHAAGGAYDYLVNGEMIGGFALIAVPADYGNSGVMTFIVNHDGVVFSKDLGPDTAKIAGAIATFDPDASWKREHSGETEQHSSAQ
jgi:hypothetical protein